MRLIIIRHAEPDYEHNSLTEKGFKEAKILCDYLDNVKIDYLYVSPLGRAIKTIEPYIQKHNKKYEIIDWLQEFEYCKTLEDGTEIKAWDNQVIPFEEIEENFDNSRCYQLEEMKITGITKHYDEIISKFDDLLKKHGYEREGHHYKVINENHDTVVLVCHLGLQMVIVSHLINLPFRALGQHFGPVPSSITTIYTEERKKGIAQFRIQSFGDVSHLVSSNEPLSFAGRFSECYSDDTRK